MEFEMWTYAAVFIAGLLLGGLVMGLLAAASNRNDGEW